MVCPGGTFGDVPATIRNYSATAKTVTYQLQAVACSGGAGPFALSFTPSSDTVVVPAYGTAEFPVRVTLPNDMPCNTRACFEMVVQDATGFTAISPEAQINRSCAACVTVPFTRLTMTNLLPQTTPLIRIQNLGNGPLSIAGARWVVFGPDMQADTRVVSLNGYPPGPLVGIPNGPASLPPNGVLDLPLDVTFTSFQPGQRFTVVLEANLDNSGVQAIASFDLFNKIPTLPGFVKITGGPNGSISLSIGSTTVRYWSAPTVLGPWTEHPSGATNAVIVPSPNVPARLFRLRR